MSSNVEGALQGTGIAVRIEGNGLAFSSTLEQVSRDGFIPVEVSVQFASHVLRFSRVETVRDEAGSVTSVLYRNPDTGWQLQVTV